MAMVKNMAMAMVMAMEKKAKTKNIISNIFFRKTYIIN